MKQRAVHVPVLVLATLAIGLFTAAGGHPARVVAQSVSTATPIQHLVVIFGENVSFDHYFATYPVAQNTAGDPPFTAAAGTPSINGLTQGLLTHNPNLDQPFRLARTQALTCDQDHGYTSEQKAFNGSLMNQFVQDTEGKASNSAQYCPADASGNRDTVMGYFDGNTVTALWNYAQDFALNDNSYGTNFGPSTPGALNLISSQTGGVLCGPQGAVFGDVAPCGDKGAPPATSTTTAAPSNGAAGTNYNDRDPYWDVCSAQDASSLLAMGGRNIGDLLNAAGVTWGWFEGGFTLDAGGKCSAKHADLAYDAVAGIDPASDPNTVGDYIPHHEPFQYYASTANPMHLPPTSTAMIGGTDQANHQYGMSSFWQAAQAGNLPAVSFLKAPAYQDGHAGYSDPLDEQQFVVDTINRLEALPQWSSTAVIINYDDSDGWYDHVPGPIVNGSNTPLDVACNAATAGLPARCGYGPRIPLMVISPYARQNYVSHHLTDQSSILRFIEDNWLGGERIDSASFDNLAGSIQDMFDFSQTPSRTLLLDPVSGEPAQSP